MKKHRTCNVGAVIRILKGEKSDKEMEKEIFYIPIDFCPKCKNKRIRVVQGKTYETEYSLTGKCLCKSKFPDTTYILLKCTKCGWQSSSWNEAGYENEDEYKELEKLYLQEVQNEQ